MRRAAFVSAVLVLALLAGVGIGHALSLRSSAAETFLGDVAPGSSVVFSRALGSRLHLENSGAETFRVAVRAAAPSSGELVDGYETWPSPGRVRLDLSQAELRPGGTADVEMTVPVPQEKALNGGQYQFDVLATGFDRKGESLTLKTKVLLSVGPPLSRAGDVPDKEKADRPGFSLAPPSAALEKVPLGKVPGGETTLKLVNAGDEDLTVTLTSARDWDEKGLAESGESFAPNPRWLVADPSVVKVRAGAIGSARIVVSVPREARYFAKRWAFVAAVDAAARGRKTRRYFVLHVATRGANEEEDDKRVR